MTVVDPSRPVPAPADRLRGRRRASGSTHLAMEERFPVEVRRALALYAHEVETLDPWSPGVGGAQAIAVDPVEGVFQGGADPRRDGFAFGL